ncbi:MAG TPA: hypothetical protein VKT77_00005, partial [Chthonomonadaceae bacterium]|nr:hypothetical protein [Chthonomonadaceae bacterium]
MGTEAASRPHAERIRSDIAEIRAELVKTLAGLTAADLDWSPRPDLKMKSFKQILQEVGTMEKVTRHMASRQEVLDWG